MHIQRYIEEKIIDALKELGYYSDDLNINVEYTNSKQVGDYSSTIALQLAGRLKRNPMHIADEVAAKLELGDWGGDIKVAKPGFINICLAPAAVQREAVMILAGGDAYGAAEYGAGKKYMVEFVSANPTGPLNVVNARAAAVGNAICNLLSLVGYEVWREYYINDAGTQMQKFGDSVRLRYRELLGEHIDFPETCYQGEYVRDIAGELRETQGDLIAGLNNEEDARWFFITAAREKILQWQKATLEQYGVTFDCWYSEMENIHDSGLIGQARGILEEKGFTYKADGALWLKTEAMGDDKDRVLVRTDGTPTYFLGDIAYHRDKFDRGYDFLLDLWGPDHHGHIKRTALALNAAGCPAERLTVLIIQQVNFLQKGIEAKMSKRAGKFVTLLELMEEIPKDAIKFFFLMRKSDSHLDFDIELAKKQSDENPVFYVQYAHARICSILRNAAERGVSCNDSAGLDRLQDPYELSVLKKLAQYPDEVLAAACSLQPHRLVNYIRELAGVFHAFYTHCRVIGAEPSAVENQRLLLVQAVKIVIKNGLTALGITAPESM